MRVLLPSLEFWLNSFNCAAEVHGLAEQNSLMFPSVCPFLSSTSTYSLKNSLRDISERKDENLSFTYKEKSNTPITWLTEATRPQQSHRLPTVSSREAFFLNKVLTEGALSYAEFGSLL